MKGLAIALETVGASAVIAGITVECIMQAEVGYIIITGGSVVVAVGGLIWAKLVRGSRKG